MVPLCAKNREQHQVELRKPCQIVKNGFDSGAEKMEKKNTLSSIHDQTPSGKMLWQPKELYGAISMQARVKKLLSVTSLSNSINQQVTGTQRLTTFLPHMISWTALDPGPHPICTGAIGKFHLPPALSEKVLAIKTRH
jgi:hypothetical protein